jgi:hypothetical protein
MSLTTNWHSCCYNTNIQSHQLIWTIGCALFLLFQCAPFAITIYGNFLLFLWMDLAQTLPEDVYSPYMSNLQLGLAKSIEYCRRNSRISGY